MIVVFNAFKFYYGVITLDLCLIGYGIELHNVENC